MLIFAIKVIIVTCTNYAVIRLVRRTGGTTKNVLVAAASASLAGMMILGWLFGA